MSEGSLGDLVDRLSITNLKLWFVQDAVHKAAAANQGLDAETVKKLASLNLERNRTMTAIDRCFADGLASGETLVDERPKLT